jgi:hypothetical protein
MTMDDDDGGGCSGCLLACFVGWPQKVADAGIGIRQKSMLILD